MICTLVSSWRTCGSSICSSPPLCICKGVWRQGDYVTVNPSTKGVLILGRRSVHPVALQCSLCQPLVWIVAEPIPIHSDGVLNPSGIRFGSGEIYGVLEQFSAAHTPCIEDAICVGQRRVQDNDERVFLFIKMREGYTLEGRLKGEIRSAIRKALSARHVPSFIFQVDDIPVRSS